MGFDSVATGGGFHRVLVDSAEVSQHTREDKAVARALEEAQARPASEVTVVRALELRISADPCPEGAAVADYNADRWASDLQVHGTGVYAYHLHADDRYLSLLFLEKST